MDFFSVIVPSRVTPNWLKNIVISIYNVWASEYVL